MIKDEVVLIIMHGKESLTVREAGSEGGFSVMHTFDLS